MVLKVKTGLLSPAFRPNGKIPKKYTADGDNISPPLLWDLAPDSAESLALIMEDPDAPAGTWVHWVVYDIPPTSGGLEEGIPKKDVLSNGARQGMTDGTESFSQFGYVGPYPPKGLPHRYVFRLYALDKVLELPPRATKERLMKAMRGHVVAESELVGKYGR
jgi:Raf kinase inhibitor-like YbhB/YbcL family protein